MGIRPLLGAFVIVLLGWTAPAAAAEWPRYDPQAFADAQAAGKTVYVAVHADWCPYCRRQAPILESLMDEAPFAAAVAFKVDFDSDRTFLRDHNIQQQTTILVFKGTREVARAVGVTEAEGLRRLLTEGL